jgi:hypothetical protein
MLANGNNCYGILQPKKKQPYAPTRLALAQSYGTGIIG